MVFVASATRLAERSKDKDMAGPKGFCVMQAGSLLACAFISKPPRVPVNHPFDKAGPEPEACPK
jgi:hypothetical protein